MPKGKTNYILKRWGAIIRTFGTSTTF